MLSTGLWRWYINIANTIMDIIHRPVFYSKHNVSKTGSCPRLQLLSPDKTIDNLPNCNSYINVPSSQT
jgi:hypothetical protein